jgi:hypothetical protein
MGSEVFKEIGQTRCIGNADRMESDLAVIGIDTDPVLTLPNLRADSQVAKCPF